MHNAILCLFLQIRKKLITKQIMMEKSEKAKKLREQRKYGKKVSLRSSYMTAVGVSKEFDSLLCPLGECDLMKLVL